MNGLQKRERSKHRKNDLARCDQVVFVSKVSNKFVFENYYVYIFVIFEHALMCVIYTL